MQNFEENETDSIYNTIRILSVFTKFKLKAYR
jgi:hypothetical protein